MGKKPNSAQMEETISKEEIQSFKDEATQLLVRVDRLIELGHIHGLPKFRKKILSELQFLDELLDSSAEVKRARVNGSNIPNLSAIVNIAETEPAVTHVEHKILWLTDTGSRKGTTIDIIADNGRSWLKISARNVRWFAI